MGYRVLANAPSRRFGSYSVRDVRAGDAQLVRDWRNAQIGILRQRKPLSYEEQQIYFWDVVSPDFADLEPRQVLLVLLDEEERVGYGGLTNIDWEARRAELSFLTNPERAARGSSYVGDLRAFLDLAIRGIAFEVLDLFRVWHETYGRAATHYVVLEEFGFVEEGRLRKHNWVGDDYRDSVIYGALRDEVFERSSSLRTPVTIGGQVVWRKEE